MDTATIVADFSEAGDIGKIVKKVKGLNHEIGVVVNNVGMMGPGYNMLGDMDKKVVKVMLIQIGLMGFSLKARRNC